VPHRYHRAQGRGEGPVGHERGCDRRRDGRQAFCARRPTAATRCCPAPPSSSGGSAPPDVVAVRTFSGAPSGHRRAFAADVVVHRRPHWWAEPWPPPDTSCCSPRPPGGRPTRRPDGRERRQCRRPVALSSAPAGALHLFPKVLEVRHPGRQDKVGVHCASAQDGTRVGTGVATIAEVAPTSAPSGPGNGPGRSGIRGPGARPAHLVSRFLRPR